MLRKSRHTTSDQIRQLYGKREPGDLVGEFPERQASDDGGKRGPNSGVDVAQQRRHHVASNASSNGSKLVSICVLERRLPLIQLYDSAYYYAMTLAADDWSFVSIIIDKIIDDLSMVYSYLEKRVSSLVGSASLTAGTIHHLDTLRAIVVYELYTELVYCSKIFKKLVVLRSKF